MSTENLHKLAALIRQERDTLLAAWRQEVQRLSVARNLDVPTLNDHIPDLLEELADELEAHVDESMIGELKRNSVIHGLDRLRLGFDVEEVVGEYNALRGVIQDLIERHDLSLRGPVNRTINRVIDMSIGLAVKTYAAQKALEIQQRREEHLAFVAHDLRTPLSAIAIAAKMLEVKVPDLAKDEEAATLLETMHRNVGRLNSLVVKVVQEEANLKAQVREGMARREVKLRPVVEVLVGDLSPLADASNLSLINRVPDELTAFIDAGMLTLIFQNLISNAIDYTPGGEVIIGARKVKEPAAVECWVSDNGAGIPADRLDKVFDKLETDPGRGSGMGLGLAIVKQFVEAQGGQVAVESELGQGATFRFTIPYKAEVG
ncbi:MAG TPA: HAMP domain-containing sensor histidine kinase [Pyrinomonadaceae bacterium]|nr:HAMP domain-containing sensor histidine kinase [Pyrinomonadaceae bacterium]